MTSAEEHQLAVEQRVAAEPVLSDDGAAGAGELQRLCRAANRDLPADGVGVSVMAQNGDLIAAASSDRTSMVLEELQFTLGEGPCFAAYTTRLPALVPDLGDADSMWPAYASAAIEHGVRAVFAFPLAVGAVRIGAMDVYRVRPGVLTSWSIGRALGYASAALERVLDAHEGADGVQSLLADGSEARFEVYQAQGMLMVQRGVTSDDAMLMIRARAFSSGRRIADVAKDIVARRLVIEADPPLE